MERRDEPKPGEFPFRILGGDRESKCLTWVRNNSSFLQLSGLIGLLQGLAIYVRGVVGNLLILTPVLLLIGTVLGSFHFLMLANPFWLTKWFLAVAVICVVGFYALHSADTGYAPPKRLAGQISFWLLFFLVLELSPHVIEALRRAHLFEAYGLREAFASIVGIASSAGIVTRYIPNSGPWRRRALLGVLSLLAFALTWGSLLTIANFVAYGLPPYGWHVIVPGLIALAFALCVFLYCFKSPVFRWRSRLIAMSFVLIMTSLGIAARGSLFSSNILVHSERASTHIGTITRPLSRLVDGLDRALGSTGEVQNSDKLTRALSKSVQVPSNASPSQTPESGIRALRQRIGLDELVGKIELLDRQSRLTKNDTDPDYFQALGAPGYEAKQQYNPEYFESAALFLEKAEVLSELDNIEKSVVLEKLAEAGKRQLIEIIESKRKFGRSRWSRFGKQWLTGYIKLLRTNDTHYANPKFADLFVADNQSKTAPKSTFEKNRLAEAKLVKQLMVAVGVDSNLTETLLPSEVPKGKLKDSEFAKENPIDGQMFKQLLLRFGFEPKDESESNDANSLPDNSFVQQQPPVGNSGQNQNSAAPPNQSNVGLVEDLRHKLREMIANHRSMEERILQNPDLDFETELVDKLRESREAEFEKIAEFAATKNELVDGSKIELHSQFGSTKVLGYQADTKSGAEKLATLIKVRNYIRSDLKDNVLRMKYQISPSNIEEDINGFSNTDTVVALANWAESGRSEDKDKNFGWTKKYQQQVVGTALRDALTAEEADDYFREVDEKWFLDHLLSKKRTLLEIEFLNLPFEELLNHAFRSRIAIESKDVEKELDVRFDKLRQERKTRGRIEDDLLLSSSARNRLAEYAIADSNPELRRKSVYALGELFMPQKPAYTSIYGRTVEEQQETAREFEAFKPGDFFSSEELLYLLARAEIDEERDHAEYLIRRLVFGKYGNLEGLGLMTNDLYHYAAWSKYALFIPAALLLALICWFFIDVNSTSLHSFYRDRLAYAFMMHEEPNGELELDTSVLLGELSDYANGNSIAPYHLINAAINMQFSGEDSIRTRNSDFFLFSKLFVGGKFTGYAETEEFQKFAPELNVASAMAISGAAASTAMGRYSNGVLAFFLSILNVRLGYWVPNPAKASTNFRFDHVFQGELKELAKRRKRVKSYKKVTEDRTVERKLSDKKFPSTSHDIYGVTLSGGGIRSASLNLGLLQLLEQENLFIDVDYLSTVSGGGYTGTAVSSFMRTRELLKDEKGTATPTPSPESAVEVTAATRFGEIMQNLQMRLRWMPKFWLFFLETFSRANHRQPWVNVSDGGHIENLGVYELLRRRCKLIIIGDGEADEDRVMDGLSRMMRLAEIDLGVTIEFEKEFFKHNSSESSKNYAFAKICYPPNGNSPEMEYGYAIYMRSGMPEADDVVLQNYRRTNPDFPHESTLDQNFSEPQFEAYRKLGYLNAREMLTEICGVSKAKLTLSNIAAMVEKRLSQ